MATVYLNGEFIAAENAFVSVFDRGFIFGDGVYELIPCYGGRALRLSEHLRRLEVSLNAIMLDNPYTRQKWRDIVAQLIEKNGGGSQSVYLQLTRGAAPRDHVWPEDVVATVFAMAKPLSGVSETIIKNGTSAITLDDYRWQHCHIKAISLLANVLMRQQAKSRGANEAILLRDGVLTEGAASNVFIVDVHERVLTPPKSQYLLPGISRDLVLELMLTLGLAYTEQQISAAQLLAAKEIWLTSSLREVQAVTMLDGKPVADGRPGPLWGKVYQAFQDYKRRLENDAN